MRRLSTIQKRGNPNAVYYSKADRGEERARHEYVVCREEDDPTDCAELLRVPFQTGSAGSDYSADGVTDADLLEMVRDRLTAFQDGAHACRENAQALIHIEEALLWIAKRADDRHEDYVRRHPDGETMKKED